MSEAPVRITFTETRSVDDITFEAGKTYELNPASAARWIRRNVAVLAPVVEAVEKVAKAAKNKGK